MNDMIETAKKDKTKHDNKNSKICK